MATKKKFVDPGKDNPNAPQSKPFSEEQRQSLPFSPDRAASAPMQSTSETKKDTTQKAAQPAEERAPPAVVRNPRTGRVSGVTIEGRTFLGLSPEDVDTLIAQSEGKLATPQGAVEQSDVAQQGERAQLAEGVGTGAGIPLQQIPMLSPLGSVLVSPGFAPPLNEEGLFAGADVGSAFSAGIGQAAIGAAALGGIGLAAGGVGAIPGAIVGGVGGFIRGFTGKLKEDGKQKIQAEFVALQQNSRNMRLLIIDAKTDPENALAAFNNQLAAIDAAYSQVQTESQNDLNKFLSVDAQVELARFEDFYAPGGMREILISRMKGVILNPKTDVSDLLYTSDFEQ